MNDSDLIELILMASPVVQAVMAFLALMSLAAWSVAIAKSYQMRKALSEAKMFEKTFIPSVKRSSMGMKVDFSRFPSHVYYVKIITKKGTIIKKVVLDK
mgnify:CR=1 FL=1